MNNLLNIKTPTEAQARVLKSEYGLENHGIRMSAPNIGI